jgi:hypothetical protein
MTYYQPYCQKYSNKEKNRLPLDKAPIRPAYFTRKFLISEFAVIGPLTSLSSGMMIHHVTL